MTRGPQHPARNAAILKALRQGLSPVQVAQAMSVTLGVVYGVRGRAGPWTKATHMARGERVHGAVLDAATVSWMRRVYVTHDRKYGKAALARQLGVSYSAVDRAIEGLTWRHLP